jgi:hypothetical protein
MFVKKLVEQYGYSSPVFQYILLKNGLPALPDAGPD